MSVQILPKEIRSKIRSGIAINTLVDCVEALVQNSIDANANCVAVRIDLPFYKIQVVDNGLGIDKHDFELIGERYATSKCHCLGDLGNPIYYGYRGEALASLCEISQELTVASRVPHEEKTYAKMLRGTSSLLQAAALKRPSSGTTVTVCGFLYNLPVRQAAISGAMELERVRRSLECLAISNPSISFSLRDDSSDAWCFRVPKTGSVVTTFAHIFGGVWASTLKPIVGCVTPFSISGFFSLKGHRNKNYQFLYVHKRRIANNRLVDTINQLFGFYLGCNACSTGSEANERYPVFVLKVECPVEFYDVGYHPSKTVVEFRKFEVLEELVKSTLVTFLGKNLKASKSPDTRQDDSEVSENSLDQQSGENVDISAQNYRHSLHSLAAKRAYKPEVTVTGDEDIARKRFTESPTAIDKVPTDTYFTPKTPCRTSIANLKTLNSIMEESVRLPTDGLGPFTKPSPDLPRPIRLSPALDHKRAALGKFIDVTKRQERIGKAIADLKKFSHKNQNSGSSPHVPFLEVDKPKSNSGHQKSTDFQNVTICAGPDCDSYPHDNICRSGISNTTRSNQHLGHKNDVSSAEPSDLSAADEGKRNASKVPKRTKTPSDNIFLKQRIFATSNVFGVSSSSESVSSKARFPESGVERNSVCLSLSPTSSPQPKTIQLVLENFQESSSRIPVDRDVENTETACSTNAYLDINNDRQEIHALPLVINSSGTREGQLGTATSQALKSASLSITIPSDLEMQNLDKQCDESLGGKRQWLMGTELLSKRDIYVNCETGHSYYGRPPASQTPLTSTLVAGHPLPLDTSISDKRVATRALPVRPWRSRIADHDATVSGDDRSKGSEELDVERMLRAWENPVFKVDPLLKSSLDQAGDSLIATLGLQPYVFGKGILEHVTVIAQVDQKFIVCSMREDGINDKEPTRRLLVAFDQHAVHERIRLEELIRGAEDDSGTDSLKTAELDPPLTLHLPNHVARVCQGHQLELRSKGVELSACNDSNGEYTPVCICQIPSCLVETGKEGTDQPTVEASVIENLLCELVESMENIGSFGAEMPKIIVDALKSQACHGAIKFGDRLSLEACQNLISQLSHCKLPFFCAHGRPSIVPLFDYKLLVNTDAKVKKPNLGKLI